VQDGAVRAVRIALAALAGLAGALIGAPAAFAADPTLTVNPNHGTAAATIQATYRYPSPGAGICPVGHARVVFAWDGNAIDQTRLDRRNCTVRVRLHPPRGHRDAGRHQVSAFLPGIPGSVASTGFTIDGAAPASQPAAPPATTAPAADPAVAPAVTDTGAAVDPAAPAGGKVAGTAATANAANVTPAWVSWALVLGALLVLGGAATFGMVIVRSRRERAEYP
jgi:hypothetical protein